MNVTGLLNVLELAREHELAQVFCPSSIAVFGAGCPRVNTPQETVLKPTTMYGVTKVTGELLCDYYVRRFGVDARGLRYPGIISPETLPGGGTTDYAVEIFYKAIEERALHLLPEGRDAAADDVHARLPEGDDRPHGGRLRQPGASRRLQRRRDELLGGGARGGDQASASPSFTIDYEPDFRQAIADSWPASLDDSAARAEWGWQPAYDLEAMVDDMLAKLSARHAQGNLYKTA